MTREEWAQALAEMRDRRLRKVREEYDAKIAEIVAEMDALHDLALRENEAQDREQMLTEDEVMGQLHLDRKVVQKLAREQGAKMGAKKIRRAWLFEREAFWNWRRTS